MPQYAPPGIVAETTRNLSPEHFIQIEVKLYVRDLQKAVDEGSGCFWVGAQLGVDRCVDDETSEGA
jgi:hypothetical protein